MAKAEINGASLEYVERGEGEPLILVHGSASDRRTWQPQLDEFSAFYHVIAYSRRYHWPNAPIPDAADYSMDEHVDDLAAMIRRSGAPAHVVGHSYGGFVGLLLAVREPELLRSLVLAEPPAITLFVSNTPRPSEVLKLVLTRPRTGLAFVKFGATGMGPAIAAVRKGELNKGLKLFGHATLGAETYRNLSPERLEQARANLIKAELLGSGFPRLDADALRLIRVPCLMVSGERSPRILHHITDRLQELMPHAAGVEIQRASHIMHEDNARDYNAAVLSFLERH